MKKAAIFLLGFLFFATPAFAQTSVVPSTAQSISPTVLTQDTLRQILASLIAQVQVLQTQLSNLESQQAALNKTDNTVSKTTERENTLIQLQTLSDEYKRLSCSIDTHDEVVSIHPIVAKASDPYTSCRSIVIALQPYRVLLNQQYDSTVGIDVKDSTLNSYLYLKDAVNSKFY